MKKIVILGGSGYVGTAIISFFRKQNKSRELR